MLYKSQTTARWKDRAGHAWSALLFVGLYLAGAELGHLLSFSNHFPTFWPPSGVFLAALMLSNLRRWPAIILLALISNLISDFGWRDYAGTLSLKCWFITSLEAVIGAWLLRRFIAYPFSGESLREVVGLSLLAAFATTVAGGLLAQILLPDGMMGSQEKVTWAVWCNSHMLGVIAFAPGILSLAVARTQWSPARTSWRSVVEALAAFSALTIFANLVFSEDTQPYAFLTFPILIWIALRFENWGSCVGNLIRVCIAIWSTRLGYGPFAGNYPALEQAIVLDTFLSITCASSLLLAAVVSERRRAAQALQQSEMRCRDLLENMGDLVHSVNADGKILFTNRAWRETLGYALSDLDALSIFQVVHPEDLPRYRVKLARVLSGRQADRYEFRFLTKDGRTLVVEGTCNCRIAEGQPNATRSIYRDVTSRREHETQLETYRGQLEAANAKLQRLALTDGLTGLYNRRAFHDRLQEEIERARRHSHPLSLLLIDVDHFKQVNDLFGHPTGDKVLQRVAHILEINGREYDFVARFGGEEFVIILPKTDETMAIAIAERLRTRISAVPFPERQITVSVGIATLALHQIPEEGSQEGTLLVKAADVALYQSKQQGRNRVTHAAQVTSTADVSHYDESESDTREFELAGW